MKTITLGEYLKLVYPLKLHRKRDWRISMLLRLAKYEDIKDYYLYVDGNTYAFRVGDEVTHIKDSDITKPPAVWRHKVKLLKGTTPQIKEDITTIFGNYINNTIVFADHFGDRVPYINGRLDMGVIHKAYFTLYRAKDITAKELIASTSDLEELSADSDFGVPAASITTFTTHPDMKEETAKQIAKNKDKLNDPLVQAAMDKHLVALDKKHVAGTSADDFIISGKQHAVVRKKTMIMYGSETDMDGKPTNLVATPLEGGLDMDSMPDWVNVARAGSHGRGALTALGGADVKKDGLAYGSLLVLPNIDCQTKEGLPILVRPAEYRRISGMRLLSNNEILTDEKLLSLVGKTIIIRSPSSCKSKDEHYCSFCMGDDGAKIPTAIPSAVSTVDSQSMDAMMQAAHGKSRLAIEIDLKYYAS